MIRVCFGGSLWERATPTPDPYLVDASLVVASVRAIFGSSRLRLASATTSSMPREQIRFVESDEFTERVRLGIEQRYSIGNGKIRAFVTIFVANNLKSS